MNAYGVGRSVGKVYICKGKREKKKALGPQRVSPKCSEYARHVPPRISEAQLKCA